MITWKRTTAFLMAGALTMTLFGCGGKAADKNTGGTTPAPTTPTAPAKVEGRVTLSGSTALLPLVQAAKEQFEAKNDKATVDVSPGGSFTGLTQVASGAVNVGNSDVEATGDSAKDLVDHKVAVAPFMIVVNKDVTATDITMDKLAKVLKGEITNWKDLGGKDQKITVYTRQQSSGSRATIVKVVLKGNGDITAKEAVVQDSNGKVFDGVASTPGAIGYIDAPYFKADKVNALKVDGVEYSAQAVIDGKWPIFAYEHMYTKGEATGAVKALIDFMMTPEFQSSAVEKLGFIPVSKMK